MKPETVRVSAMPGLRAAGLTAFAGGCVCHSAPVASRIRKADSIRLPDSGDAAKAHPRF